MSASTPTESQTKLTRDEARAAIFGAKTTKTVATLNGVRVYLQEPQLGAVMDFQQEEDRKRGACMMLVRFVHTEDGEPVFEEADVDSLLELPFNKDMRDLQNKIQVMLGVAPTAADKSPATEESG